MTIRETAIALEPIIQERSLIGLKGAIATFNQMESEVWFNYL